MNTNNFFLNADSYKFSHYGMYPRNTTKTYSYVESRGGTLDETLFFGMQFFTKWLDEVFPTEDDVEEANQFFTQHGVPFNYDGAMELVELGYFPLEIKAVPEGSVLPSRNILVSITNTHERFAWLPSFLETVLLNKLWYPCTVASYSLACKRVLEKAYSQTVDYDYSEAIKFALHDFGFRGASSLESAGVGGLSHLVNFVGSDTVIANSYASKYYGEDCVSLSVPAAEHSTIVSWTKDNESGAYKHILNEFPSGIVSIVADSYDIYNAVDKIFGIELKDDIMRRDGTTVIRPDSGDPTTVLFGDESSEDKQIRKGIVQIAWERFGGNTNDKGFRTLNPKVRILQGDGISLETLETLLDVATSNGWSADNFVFGMGGNLLQNHNRDTMQFACKCSYAEVDGQGRDVFKEPKTDSKKNSKRGIMSLVKDGDEYLTVQGRDENDLLETVYLDGTTIRFMSFTDVRNNANL